MNTPARQPRSPDALGQAAPALPTLADLGAQDLPEIRRLFAEVFGAPLDAALWHWKYGDQRGRAIGGYRDGRLVSHYGGVWRDVRQGDWLGTGVQFVDVMVAKEARGIFSRKNPFSRMTQAFIDRTVATDGGASFGFGFPNLRHFLLGAKLGLYDKADDIHEWSWDLQDAPQTRCGGYRPMDWNANGDRMAFDALCSRFHAALGNALAPVRRYDTWLHRFANHPLCTYQCVWLGDGSAGEHIEATNAMGALVLRVDRRSLRCEVMDCVLENPSDLPIALAVAKSFAQELGCTKLVLWGSSWVLSLLGDTWGSCALRTHVACLAVTRRKLQGFSLASTPPACWFMGGDTDFR